MINYRCYEANKLLSLLGNNFHIINKKIQESFSDWTTGDVDTEDANKFYITNRNDIKKIEEWHSLWTEIIIHLFDGTKLKLYSDNVNSNQKDLLRISKNDFISPPFKRQENYILVNNKLDEWLLYNEISKELLDNITINFELYPTYIYKNICEPIIRDNEICGCYSRNMEISEDKIDSALADIKDIEMKLKIERILKSFDKSYK